MTSLMRRLQKYFRHRSSMEGPRANGSKRSSSLNQGENRSAEEAEPDRKTQTSLCSSHGNDLRSFPRLHEHAPIGLPDLLDVLPLPSFVRRVIEGNALPPASADHHAVFKYSRSKQNIQPRIQKICF